MTKQDFYSEHKLIREQVNEKYSLLKDKYVDIYYCSEEEGRRKYGDDYHIFSEMIELYKKSNKLFNEYKNEELKNQELYTNSNVDLSVAIEVHDILLEKEFYKQHIDKNEDFDLVKVIYNCLYNDNWNDLLVGKLQLFKNHKLSKEIVIFDESLFESDDESNDDVLYDKIQNHEIEMQDCRVYSNNEAYQSFIVSKEKCSL